MNEELKIGLVGLDTSHCTAFTKILNDDQYEYHLPGGNIVAAYPGGSTQFSLCRDRVSGYTKELKESFKIRIIDDISTLVEEVEAILLLSGDGRQHLEQFKLMLAGKPVFIDKPLATSTSEAQEIIRLAKQTQTPLMSCSSLRFATGIQDLIQSTEEYISVESFGPTPVYEDYPGLFWYGIHSVEILFALMGKGCTKVSCLSQGNTHLALGTWKDGRTGVMRGTGFASSDFGCVITTPNKTISRIAEIDPPYYVNLLKQVIPFLHTGISPIDIEDTLNIINFIQAANLSIDHNGCTVQIQ